jgi:hypothetical protein
VDLANASAACPDNGASSAFSSAGDPRTLELMKQYMEKKGQKFEKEVNSLEDLSKQTLLVEHDRDDMDTTKTRETSSHPASQCGSARREKKGQAYLDKSREAFEKEGKDVEAATGEKGSMAAQLPLDIIKKMMDLRPNDKVLAPISDAELRAVNERALLPNGKCCLCDKEMKDTNHDSSRDHVRRCMYEAWADRLVGVSRSCRLRRFGPPGGLGLGFCGPLSKANVCNYWGPHVEKLGRLAQKIHLEKTSVRLNKWYSIVPADVESYGVGIVLYEGQGKYHKDKDRFMEWVDVPDTDEVCTDMDIEGHKNKGWWPVINI